VLVIVYLWQAGRDLGVTDDSKRARRLAASCMRDSGAPEAVVVTAHYGDDHSSMDPGYVDKGGLRWQARRRGSRVVWNCRWVPAPKPELALAAGW
jgi:hypothetical protein